MVLLGRIELPTSALPRMRSTTELQQHTISAAPHRQTGGGQGRAIGRAPWFCQAGLAALISPGQKGVAMHDAPAKMTREERLAARLRDNLRRRKAQARDIEAADTLPKPDQTS